LVLFRVDLPKHKQAQQQIKVVRMKAVVLVLLLAGVAWGQRPDTVAVVNKLNEVHPLFRQIQDYVINTISEARLSSSSKIYDFHKDVILTKSTFLGTSIKQEQELLTQVNGQPGHIDQQCLAFIRQSADVNMNLAGVSYTNCLTQAGDSLMSTVQQFYSQLDVDERKYVGVGLFEEFRGENVFFDPRKIIQRLENRMFMVQEYPTHIGSEMLDAISGFSNQLDSVRMAYVSCMTMGEQLLKSSLQMAQLQLEVVCNGLHVPTPESIVPPTPSDYVTEPNTEVPEPSVDLTDAPVPPPEE
uniref:Protein TsetseEP domain-containing protein n=1 Tax=Anopheles atroparvus TaxID=41427 RepID=A0A182INX0_ANOAO